MRKKNKNANYRLHKVTFYVLLSALIIFASSVRCSAEQTYIDTRIDGIIDEFSGALPSELEELSDVSSLNEALGVKRVLADIITALSNSSGELLSLLLSMLGIAIMSALTSLSDTEISQGAQRAVGIVGAALLLERLAFLIKGAGETMGEINRFFGTVIPISLAVNSLGAAPTTASTQALGMGLTLSAYSFVSERVIGGVVGAVFICSALSSLDPMLSRLSRCVKNVFISLLGALTVLIGATFALQSSICASADSMAIRSARYAVAGTIPIVGNAVSSALGIVAGGVSYARSIVGTGAIAVILSLVLSPLVTLLSYRLVMRVGGALCSWCSLDGCEGIFSSFLASLDSLIAVYSLTALIYVTELVAFLKGGVSIA